MMRPMLAAKAKVPGIQFPVIASPKLDGVRALIIDGVVMSRSLKPIPNEHVQKTFGKKTLNGLDGELIVGSPTAEDVYRVTTSGVMSRDGKPDVRLFVFDDLKKGPEPPFKKRLAELSGRIKRLPSCVELLEQHWVEALPDLRELESRVLAAGYEGLILRGPDAPYKYGRSTMREQGMLKLKTFLDAEALVIGVEELMHNANEATLNELGLTKRSTHKANKVPRNMLGALTVRDPKTKVEFSIGTGFTEEMRKQYWAKRKSLVGKVVKYKYFPGGVKDAPRFPVFLGFRHPIDM